MYNTLTIIVLHAYHMLHTLFIRVRAQNFLEGNHDTNGRGTLALDSRRNILEGNLRARVYYSILLVAPGRAGAEE